MLDSVNNPLSQYILQIIKNNKLLEDDGLDPFTKKLNYNKNDELIFSDQSLDLRFIVSSLDQFTKSCRILDIVKHQLFLNFMISRKNIPWIIRIVCIFENV